VFESAPQPYVVVRCGVGAPQKTAPTETATCNPQWETAFRVSCACVESDQLVCDVFAKGALTDSLIGAVHVSLNRQVLVRGLVNDEWYVIVGTNAQIRLRILPRDFGSVDGGGVVTATAITAATATQAQQHHHHHHHQFAPLGYIG